jgi:hypothetical protein
LQRAIDTKLTALIATEIYSSRGSRIDERNGSKVNLYASDTLDKSKTMLTVPVTDLLPPGLETKPTA